MKPVMIKKTRRRGRNASEHMSTRMTRKYFCNACFAEIPTILTRLMYVPKRRRVCPFCGKELLRMLKHGGRANKIIEMVTDGVM
jgi:rRNA maturation endonuclease Nob1